MQINRNYHAAQYFISAVIRAGVHHFVISPGSRNTPLILAATAEKKARCFSAVDERGAAFFASGIARSTKKPVALLCTSGTAAAEYLPAIVESFHQRIPLIVCTADRPSYLQNMGANQTINQQHLYGTHVRYFADTGLPQPTRRYFSALSAKIQRGLSKLHTNPGPIHFNFPFEKPFEPDAVTDEIRKNAAISNLPFPVLGLPEARPLKNILTALRIFLASKRPLILCGPMPSSPHFAEVISRFAEEYQIPVFADIASNLRHAKRQRNISFNYDTMLKTAKENWKYYADCILVFGRTMTSASVDRYLSENKAPRLIVNEFGDRFDTPGKHRSVIVHSDPAYFLGELKAHLRERKWVGPAQEKALISGCEAEVRTQKKMLLRSTKGFHEPFLVSAVAEALPSGANLFLPNSLFFRDFDNFAEALPQGVKVFQNRGASGIEGNIASAAGIAATDTAPSYLIIGDVAFYYDINSLWLLKKHSIPLKILLLNNRGGRIFDHLPVSRYPEALREFFITDTNLEFAGIIAGFGCEYARVTDDSTLRPALAKVKESRGPIVAEILIDPGLSLAARDEFRTTVGKRLKALLAGDS